MERAWKFGLVGVGGLNRARAYTHNPRVQVTAICDVDAAQLVRVQRVFELPDSACYTDFQDLLASNCDVVVVATPIKFHAQQIRDALVAGKHVLSEVTLGNTVEECLQVLSAVQRAKTQFMLAENYIYFRYIQDWGNLIRSGRLGDIFHMEAEYVHEIRHLLRNPQTGEEYWRDSRPPIHYPTHCLGPTLYFLPGDRIVRALGIGRQQRINPAGGRGWIDMQMGIFETANGVSIKILRSQSAPREPHVVHYAVYGTQGYVENGKLGYNTKGLIYVQGESEFAEGSKIIDCDPVDPVSPPEARQGGHGSSEYYLLQDFLTALDRDTTPPIDIYKGLEMCIPGLLAHQSAMEGSRWIDVPDFRS